MGFTIYDAGFLEWFDIRQSGIIGEYEQAAWLQQTIGSPYAKVTPFYSILFKWGYNNLSEDAFVKKTLPEVSNEVWASANVYWYYDGNVAYNRLNKILSVEAIGGNAIASVRMVGYGQPKSAVAQVFVGETYVGEFGLATNAVLQVEMRCRVDAVNGLVQVWRDGEMVFDWTGNTGTAGIARVAHYSGVRIRSWYSSFVYSNEGRIGGKQPVICSLVGAGDTSDGTYTSFLGNVVGGTGTSNALTGTKTLVTDNKFPEPGTIKTIKTYLSTGGTYKVGVVTVNPTNNLKRTIKYASDILTAASGEVVLSAGMDFPANWTVDTNDAVAVCAITATISANYGTPASQSEGVTTLCSSFTGDGLSLSDPTEKTYTAIPIDGFGKGYYYRLAAVYTAVDSTYAYKLSSNENTLYIQPYTETHRYLEQFAENQTNLFAIKDLPIACTVVKGVKFTIRGTGGATLTSADFILKVGETEYAVNKVLPTSSAFADAYLTGAWSPANYNAAQLGIRAKP